jgi:hypothetical protein
MPQDAPPKWQRTRLGSCGAGDTGSGAAGSAAAAPGSPANDG